MNKECHDEVTLVEADCLLDTLENYLHKHKYDKKNSNKYSWFCKFLFT